jgi:uncharacterized protein (TIGR03435 family)
MGTAYGPAMVQGNAVTMAEFAGLLTNSLNRPVQDLTGLTGTYKIKLHWLPDGPAPPNSDELASSPFVAVQELGLRLEVHKTPVELLIVDHAERTPIDN